MQQMDQGLQYRISFQFLSVIQSQPGGFLQVSGGKIADRMGWMQGLHVTAHGKGNPQAFCGQSKGCFDAGNLFAGCGFQTLFQQSILLVANLLDGTLQKQGLSRECRRRQIGPGQAFQGTGLLAAGIIGQQDGQQGLLFQAYTGKFRIWLVLDAQNQIELTPAQRILQFKTVAMVQLQVYLADGIYGWRPGEEASAGWKTANRCRYAGLSGILPQGFQLSGQFSVQLQHLPGVG